MNQFEYKPAFTKNIRYHFFLFSRYKIIWMTTEGMEANQDCTILWYKKSILGFEMTKLSKQRHSNSNHRSLLGSAGICNHLEEGANIVKKSATQGKIAIIVEQSCTLITTKLDHRVARTSPRRLSHPARAGFILGRVPKILLFFSFFAQPPSPLVNLPLQKPNVFGEDRFVSKMFDILITNKVVSLIIAHC